MAEGLLTRPISYSLLCESIFLFGTFFLGLIPVLDECDYIFYVYIPSIFRFKSYARTPSPRSILASAPQQWAMKVIFADKFQTKCITVEDLKRK